MNDTGDVEYRELVNQTRGIRGMDETRILTGERRTVNTYLDRSVERFRTAGTRNPSVRWLVLSFGNNILISIKP